MRRGDLTGLEGLMGRHQGRLFRYLRRLLGDEVVAEDLFQHTWVHVAERIRRYDPQRPFRPWLLAVAHNLAFDHLRRRPAETLYDGPEPEAPTHRVVGRAAEDPLARIAAWERRERIAAAVGSLAAPDREVLALRFEEELPLSELAGVLGVPVPTAKARLYRALARLKTRLLAEGPREDWT